MPWLLFLCAGLSARVKSWVPRLLIALLRIHQVVEWLSAKIVPQVLGKQIYHIIQQMRRSTRDMRGHDNLRDFPKRAFRWERFL